MCELLNALGKPIIPDLVWLGRNPGWIDYEKDVRDGGPSTRLEIDVRVLEAKPDAAAHRRVIQIIDTVRGMPQTWSMVACLDALARLVKDGPKKFTPSEEQFESMEHVELHIPIGDFATPFESMVVDIPLGARNRLAAQCGIRPCDAPKTVLIMCRRDPGKPAVIVMHMGDPVKSGASMDAGGGSLEVFYLFQERPENPTIEAVLNRDAGNQTSDAITNIPLFNFGLVAARAAMNLCLMLTHYGHRVTYPANYHKREVRRAHQLHGDFLTVNMQQDVVIRATGPGVMNVPGPGTGIEVKPHWRRGHWRAYPGQAAKRAAGEKVDLLFIRPTLVRADRADGDISDSSATYR